MGGIGPEKILLLAVVVLLLFGAKRIPEIGASFGKGIKEFKKSIGDNADDTPSARQELREPARDVDTTRREAENVEAGAKTAGLLADHLVGQLRWNTDC